MHIVKTLSSIVAKLTTPGSILEKTYSFILRLITQGYKHEYVKMKRMKSTIRDALLTQRLAMTPEDVIQASLSIIYQLVKHPLFIQSKHIGLFHPIKNEPNLTSLVNLSYKQFYLPVVKEPSLIYSRFTKDTPLVKSSLNILEPTSTVDESNYLDLVIIPAIAIDKERYRLGFGKGYFDRFLALYPKLKVLAVIYPFQHIESFEHDLHDMPVDDVILSD